MLVEDEETCRPVGIGDPNVSIVKGGVRDRVHIRRPAIQRADKLALLKLGHSAGYSAGCAVVVGKKGRVRERGSDAHPPRRKAYLSSGPQGREDKRAAGVITLAATTAVPGGPARRSADRAVIVAPRPEPASVPVTSRLPTSSRCLSGHTPAIYGAWPGPCGVLVGKHVLRTSPHYA